MTPLFSVYDLWTGVGVLKHVVEWHAEDPRDSKGHLERRDGALLHEDLRATRNILDAVKEARDALGRPLGIEVTISHLFSVADSDVRGVARTSRDPPQEPHYGDEVKGPSHV